MLEILASYPRRLAVGDSFAFVGPVFALAVLRLETPAADAVAAWVDAQDSVELVASAPLPDGRDVALLRRLHTKQSMSEALEEQRRFATR